MINFVDRYHVPNLNQYQVNHLKRSIFPKVIEAGIRSLSITKSQGPEGFSSELYQTFKEDLLLKLLTILHKTEIEGTLPNTFYETTVILIRKVPKGLTSKYDQFTL